ncbi:MAG: T9SS type A sorting domain-containing protein [candidate division WOR-3 bacterium]|nr:T9SS type A sorting domain-containing protein [candidate division WOR-3 bacterium]MDW7987103.1 T9SS type A sorting domain-containing protein [candidate division WOR-3 bacterium]
MVLPSIKKNIYIFILSAILISTQLSAQAITDYSFVPSMGTFTPLTGATVPPLSGGSLDDGYYNNIPIGFTFNYLGVGYTMLSATTNGCVVLGQTLSSPLITNDLTSGTPRPILAPLWDDLDQETFGTFSYKTEGTAPNRVFTAEWLNYAWNYTATVPVISFQLKLYEAGGKIEFIYRQEAGAVVSGSASIGITAVGTGPGNFLSLDGTGPTPNVSSTIETNTINTKPATGQIYAFVMIPYPTISHTPLSSDTTTGPRLVRAVITSAIGIAPPPNQPRLYYRTSPGAYTAVTMVNVAGDTWQAMIPGQPQGTLVEYYIAAQDVSTPPLVRTAPPGGGGVNPPGTIPPSVPYSYYIQRAISGIKYIVSGVTAQDTYPSFTAAINDLNASVVGLGGVTFNVPGGQTFVEILPPITATGAPNRPIVFQKTGPGPNPIVRRTDAGSISTSILGGQGDAVIIIDGGDYITFDGIDVNATNSGIEYGYYLRKRSSADGCKNVTIRNSNIIMTKGTSQFVVGIYASNNDAASLPSSATGITITADSGRTENLRILSNNIQNVFTGIILRGNISYPDLYPVIGDSNVGNSITNYAGNVAAEAYGIYMIYQIMPKVSYNYISNTANGGANFTAAGYGIMNTTTTNGGGTITNNVVDLTTTSGILSGIYSTTGGTNPLVYANNSIRLSATGGSGAIYFLYATGTYPSVTITNNVFASNGIASTGTCYLIFNSNPTPNIVVSNNITSGIINRTASSGTFYGYYNFGSPTSGTEYLLNNNFSNINLAGTSVFYGIYSYTTTSQNRVASGNVISNIVGGTGLAYCLTFLSTTTNQIYNNIVDSIVSGGTIYGLYFTGTNPTVYNNIIRKLRTSGTTNYGIFNGGTGTTYCYNNIIHSLTSTTTGSPVVYGIHVSTGTSNNIYNNSISNLNAPSGSSATAIAGINIAGGTAVNLYYNSIYINATSTGATFGTSGIFASTTPTVDMRNNVIVNTSTPNGTGLTVAYRRSSTTLTTYATTSNNNCFYAGTPSASRLIFYDGTNADQTLAQYKARVMPRDWYSVTEAVNFVSATDLHINPAIPTRLESGAQPISWITTDIDGQPRVGSSKINTNVMPDIGADEFSGTPIDEFGPVITYTPLPYTGSTGNRTLTVTITDLVSGVSVEPGRRPTLYYNKNRGPWFSDSLLAPPWIFTINVANLGGVTVGDTVFYYVRACDSSGNVSVNPITAPSAPNFYVVTPAPLSGNYTVGLAMFNELAGRNIYFEKRTQKVLREVQVPVISSSVPFTDKSKPVLTSDDVELTMRTELVEVEEIVWVPMENGQPYIGDLYVKKSENPDIKFPEGIDGVYATITAAIADLNLRGVNGPTNFLLVDPTYPNETYPLTIDVRNEFQPTAVNRVTIRPNTGIVATISGSVASAPIFRIISSYIIIDGSNSGSTDRSLTIRNTSTTSPQVIAIAPATTTPTIGVTIKNCIIINVSNTTSAVVIGNPGYFNDITIENNSIQLAYIGVYVRADPVTGSNGSSVRIIGNDLNTAGTNAIRLVGVYFQGIQRSLIANNNIGNFNTSDASNITGVWLALDTRTTSVVNNIIGPIVSSTGAPRGIAVSSGIANTNIVLSRNTVTGISTSYSSAPYGIYIFSTTTGVTVEKNNVTGIYNTNTGGYGARGIHVNTGIPASNIIIKNNFVSDIKATSDASTTYWGIGIGVEGATGGVKVNNNSVYLSGTMAGYSSATVHAAFAVITSTAADLDVRNNIFVNSFDNTNSTTDKSYAINSQAPASAFTNIDYNDYYVSGPAGVLGYLNSDRLTLSAWQTATGQDQRSISADPMFTSTTDLHIPRSVLSPINRRAVPLSWVSDDFDNESRHPLRPDIGADEYTPYPPQQFDLVSPTNGSVTQPLIGTLVWRRSLLAEFYNLYLSVDSPPSMLISTQTDTTYQYSLLPNKTYYWQVVALNDTEQVFDAPTYSQVWKFRTEIWDVGVLSIIKPGPIGFAGNVIVPKVKVKNFGDVPRTFTVTMRIGNIYTDCETIYNLAPQETLIVNFEPWTAVLGNYNLLAYTTLAQDNNPQNDTVRGTTEIQPPAHDVGVVTIVFPPDTVLAGRPIAPRVRIKNFGAFTETFNVRFRIGNLYNEAILIQNLESNAETTVTFPAWIAQPCNYVASCSTELVGDQLPENDAAYKTLTVQYYDVGVAQILVPQDTIFANTEYYPTLVIVNNGIHIPQMTPVNIRLTIRRYPIKMISYCSIGRHNVPIIVKVYEWSTEIPIGTSVITAPSNWKPIFWDAYWIADPTYHEVIAEVTTPNDMVSANNILLKQTTVKCNIADLQMNWTGLLLEYTPQHIETLPFRTYNVASVITSGSYDLASIPFRARVQIFRESDNALVYSRYLDREIPKTSYLCLPFSSGFTPSTPGWYKIKSWIETRPGIDLIAENNTCVRRYYFMDMLPAIVSKNITQTIQSNIPQPTKISRLFIKPNPVSNQTKISWQLTVTSNVVLRLYDINGRVVNTLFDGNCNPGIYEVNWRRENHLPAGIYFCELIADGQKLREKLIITE